MIKKPASSFLRSDSLKTALRDQRSSNLWRLLGLVILAGVWDIIALAIKSPFMPHLAIILSTIMRLLFSARIWIHIGSSLERVIVGLVIASVFGILLGIIMTQFRFIMFVISPVIDVMRSVAGLAIYPLIILFLGLESAPKIFLVFWGAWPPIVLNTIHAITQVDRVLIEAAEIDGATRFQSLRHIIFPLSSQTIITGVRIGAGVGWISVVASEMLSGNNGLGYFILTQSQIFHYPELFAGILLVSVFGLTTHILLAGFQLMIERRLYK